MTFNNVAFEFEDIAKDLDKVLTNIEEFWNDYGLNTSEERTVENTLDEVFGALEKKYNVVIKRKIEVEIKE